ncbi:fructokinase [Ahniella affigens]|uniref:fructokinase n=1 Tax=Ahniella affigens TaxID=2021234 RepID=A0A2P1PLX0_9GAMM|nr:ROK family protein [Ahniella affigens]AVP95836.1 fructokinase [Ahniella affigens]
MTWFACIEGGGTKFALAASFDGVLTSRLRVDTRSPTDTLGDCVRHFQELATQFGPPAAIGIGCFGPLDLRPRSPQFGHVLATPKAGWSGVDLVTPFRTAFAVPVGIDTDVNAAALGEQQFGAGRACQDLVYLTVGTGIGGGLLVRAEPVHGCLHPEVGHLRPRRHAADQDFAGVCPFHQDCFEGLASGVAIAARFGTSLDQLPADHVGHDIIADYLGQLSAQLALMFAPERIIVGGGVLGVPGLLERVQARQQHWLGGYLPAHVGDGRLCAPALGGDSGLMGAYVLARRALDSRASH